MSQITRCPSCATSFKVVADQLRISDGWVRCGQCKEVFDALASLHTSKPAPLLPDMALTGVMAAPSAPHPSVPESESRTLSPESTEDSQTPLPASEMEVVVPALEMPDSTVPAFLAATSPQGVAVRPAAFLWQTESSVPPTVPVAAADAPATEHMPSVGNEPAQDATDTLREPLPDVSAVHAAHAVEALDGALAFEREGVSDASSVPENLGALHEKGGMSQPPLLEAEEAVQPLAPVSTAGPLASPLNTFAPAALPLSAAMDDKPGAVVAGEALAELALASESLQGVEPQTASAVEDAGEGGEAVPPVASQSPPTQGSALVSAGGGEDDSDESDDVAEPEVGFVVKARRKAFWQRTSVRAVLWLLIVLACGGLVLQLVVQERNRIAALDARTKPWLAQLCAPLRCELSTQRQITDLVIDSSSFNRARGDSYVLNITLKNQAALALAMPAVELTLTDAQDQPVLRRVLLPGDMAAPAELPAKGEWQAAVPVIVTTGGARVAGYRVLVFYP